MMRTKLRAPTMQHAAWKVEGWKKLKRLERPKGLKGAEELRLSTSDPQPEPCTLNPDSLMKKSSRG